MSSLKPSLRGKTFLVICQILKLIEIAWMLLKVMTYCTCSCRSRPLSGISKCPKLGVKPQKEKCWLPMTSLYSLLTVVQLQHFWTCLPFEKFVEHCSNPLLLFRPQAGCSCATRTKLSPRTSSRIWKCYKDLFLWSRIIKIHWVIEETYQHLYKTPKSLGERLDLVSLGPDHCYIDPVQDTSFSSSQQTLIFLITECLF